MKAETVRKILVTEDLKQTAKELTMPYSNVRGIRLHWLRRLSGKCAICGTPNEESAVCDRCKKTINKKSKLLVPRQSSRMISMLERVDESAPLLRRECTECGTVVELTAGYVIEMWRKMGPGFMKRPFLCVGCVHKMLRKRRERPLSYRPFEGLKVKIRK